MTILICLFIVGWAAAALIGTQAYFRGEQTKPIRTLCGERTKPGAARII